MPEVPPVTGTILCDSFMIFSWQLSGQRPGQTAKKLRVHCSSAWRSYCSPVPVIRENVVSCLHDRVAREPALGIIRLRRPVSQGAGRERIGRGVILEDGPSPSAAVRKPLAVFHHEVDVMLGAWHRR